jgi:hypothetical protein
MALFNRKRREPDEPQPDSQDAAAGESPEAEPAAAEPAAPSMAFTTTTVGRADPANLSFAMPSAPVPEAPKAPVGPHHADVAASLQRWAKGNSPQALADVLRQAARGQLLLDISASELKTEDGKVQRDSTIAVASRRAEDGRNFLLVFTSNAELRKAHKDGEIVRSMVQPALGALRLATREQYEGVIVDAGSGAASIVIPKDQIVRGLPVEPGANEALKEALATKPEGRLNAVMGVLAETETVFLAVERKGEVVEGQPPAPQDLSVAGVKAPDGRSYAAAFTSPAEVWAWSPKHMAVPVPFTKHARSVLSAPSVEGLLFNPAGPTLAVLKGDLEKVAAAPTE